MHAQTHKQECSPQLAALGSRSETHHLSARMLSSINLPPEAADIQDELGILAAGAVVFEFLAS